MRSKELLYKTEKKGINNANKRVAHSIVVELFEVANFLTETGSVLNQTDYSSTACKGILEYVCDRAESQLRSLKWEIDKRFDNPESISIFDEEEEDPNEIET